MQHILALIALLALVVGCAARELRCDGALEPINSVPSTAHAAHAGDIHGR